jgi:hypothetical protein
MDDDTQLNAPGRRRLCVVEGPDAGAVYELDREGEYCIGRKEDCDIAIANDMATSRAHAVLRIENGACSIEDQGSGNGIAVNNASVQKSVLKHNDSVQIGGNLLIFETDVADSEETTRYKAPPSEAATIAPPGARSRLQVYALVVCLLAALGFLALAVLREKAPQSVAPRPLPAPAPAAAPSLPTPKAPETAPAPTVASPVALKPPPAAETSPPEAVGGNSAELFQNGMFFYRAGNIKRAADVWAEALALDPANANVQKWMQRAERELDQEIDKRYRQGLLAKKYMRRDEAKHELQLVVEWSRDKNDERYLNALKLLEELARE